MFGAKGGAQLINALYAPTFTYIVPALEPAVDIYSVTAKPFIYGPTVEVRLPWNLAIEAEALHKDLRYSFFTRFRDATDSETTKAGFWEIPLLLKRHFPGGNSMRPYGDIGLSQRHISGSTHVHETSGGIFGKNADYTQPISPAVLKHPWTTGVSVGGGVDIHVGIIHFLPEVRYTHWSSEPLMDNFVAPVPIACFQCATLRSRTNTLDLLVGLGIAK